MTVKLMADLDLRGGLVIRADSGSDGNGPR